MNNNGQQSAALHASLMPFFVFAGTRKQWLLGARACSGLPGTSWSPETEAMGRWTGIVFCTILKTIVLLLKFCPSSYISRFRWKLNPYSGSWRRHWTKWKKEKLQKYNNHKCSEKWSDIYVCLRRLAFQIGSVLARKLNTDLSREKNLNNVTAMNSTCWICCWDN